MPYPVDPFDLKEHDQVEQVEESFEWDRLLGDILIAVVMLVPTFQLYFVLYALCSMALDRLRHV